MTWAAENNGEKQEEERVTEEPLERQRLQKWEKAGIKVLPAAVRYSRSGRRAWELLLLLWCGTSGSCTNAAGRLM